VEARDPEDIVLASSSLAKKGGVKRQREYAERTASKAVRQVE
jgi:hypothetical protein